MEPHELRLLDLICFFVFFYLGLTSVTFVSGSKALIKEEPRRLLPLQVGQIVQIGQIRQVLVQHSEAP